LNPEFFTPLRKLAALQGGIRESYLVYGGSETFRRESVRVMSWKDMARLAELGKHA